MTSPPDLGALRVPAWESAIFALKTDMVKEIEKNKQSTIKIRVETSKHLNDIDKRLTMIEKTFEHMEKVIVDSLDTLRRNLAAPVTGLQTDMAAVRMDLDGLMVKLEQSTPHPTPLPPQQPLLQQQLLVETVAPPQSKPPSHRFKVPISAPYQTKRPSTPAPALLPQAPNQMFDLLAQNPMLAYMMLNPNPLDPLSPSPLKASQFANQPSTSTQMQPTTSMDNSNKVDPVDQLLQFLASSNACKQRFDTIEAATNVSKHNNDMK